MIFQCEFQVGSLVLLYNSRLQFFPRKLKSRKSGLFRVSNLWGNGAIEVDNKKGETFKMNGQHLKKYFGEPPNVKMVEVVYFNEE